MDFTRFRTKDDWCEPERKKIKINDSVQERFPRKEMRMEVHFDTYTA